MEEIGKAELAGTGEENGDISERTGVHDSDGGRAGADDGAATEKKTYCVDYPVGEFGEVGVGDLADPAAVPVGGSNEDSGARLAVGNTLDIHG